MAVECDYKATGICQYPILHDLDGNKGGAVFRIVDEQKNDVTDTNIWQSGRSYKFNTKNLADVGSGRIRTYKSNNKVRFTKSGQHQVYINIYFNSV